MHELILASRSPRRQQLLEKAGYKFRSVSVEISEKLNKNVNLEDAVRTLAEDKALAFVKANKGLKSQKILVLAADTIVAIDGRALGKPNNLEQAVEFLKLLSGKKHEVITAFSLVNLENLEIFSQAVVTCVEFRVLAEAEISEYVASGEPMDKAGAYAIQGAGGKFVAAYHGDWNNVVGLPVDDVERALSERGWHVPRKTN